MPTKEKKPYVNQYFDEETRQKAKELIETGRMFEGGFWRNRSKTAARLGYETWENVPKKIQQCLNQINRAAVKRGKEKKRQEAEALNTKHYTQKPVLEKPLRSQGDFTLSPDVLEDIRTGTLKIPKTASQQQIRTIREYVTHASGFDPKRLLLGVDSHMER